MEQGYEDTMMGSHPGGRVTACSVRCSILEYLMDMVVIFIFLLGALVFFGCWSKAIGSILRTSDRPSRNIDRVISGHLRSWVSQLRPVLSGMDHKYGAGCVYPRKAMCDLILGKDGRPDPWMMNQGFDGHFLSNAMLFRHGGTEPWPWPTEPCPWPVQEVIVLGHRPD
ncbi:hypothetical protein F2Q69_00030007 [Brassica cretica]|uniref:Uncharacterized protein n=1 Tax=Brassica cretica TaxID=69181 RepID=A0A8S9RUX7_BRACR|nr:hypothetical protein F2Q69_00030007 [Brassica cretica]